MIDADFLDLMKDTIQIRRHSTGTPFTSYGALQHDTGVAEIRCRIVQKSRLFRMEDGRKVFARGKIYVYGDANITTQDKIVLPDGTSPEIVFIENFPDDQGDIHQVLNYQ